MQISIGDCVSEHLLRANVRLRGVGPYVDDDDDSDILDAPALAEHRDAGDLPRFAEVLLRHLARIIGVGDQEPAVKSTVWPGSEGSRHRRRR